MGEGKRYTFGLAKRKRSAAEGFRLEESGRLRLTPGKGAHRILFPAVDTAGRGSAWGRLHVEARLPRDSVWTAAVLVSEEPLEIWETLLERRDARTGMGLLREKGVCRQNQEDFLFMEKRGRYLYTGVEVFAEGEGWLGEVFAEQPGDNFLQTFPEIYRQEGSFFHRYLAIFSSVYNDIWRETKRLETELSPERAPEKLLRELAVSAGFPEELARLPEGMLRKLLQRAGWLMEYKGTKAVFLFVAEAMCGGVRGLEEDGNRVLLFLEKRPGREAQERLSCAGRCFLPAGTELRLLCGAGPAGMDGAERMDVRGALRAPGYGSLDGSACAEEICLGKEI